MDNNIRSKIDNIINNLPSSVDPLAVLELRDLIEELECQAGAQAYTDGLKEGILRAAMDGEETFLRGEAKGVLWAYHALKGNPVDDLENPFIHETIIRGIMRP
jgi:hypothetical protein